MRIRELKKGDIITGLLINDEAKDLIFQKMDGGYCIATIPGDNDYVNLRGGTEIEEVEPGIYRVI